MKKNEFLKRIMKFTAMALTAGAACFGAFGTRVKAAPEVMPDGTIFDAAYYADGYYQNQCCKRAGISKRKTEKYCQGNIEILFPFVCVFGNVNGYNKRKANIDGKAGIGNIKSHISFVRQMLDFICQPAPNNAHHHSVKIYFQQC